jgi:hypothetical protein
MPVHNMRVWLTACVGVLDLHVWACAQSGAVLNITFICDDVLRTALFFLVISGAVSLSRFRHASPPLAFSSPTPQGTTDQVGGKQSYFANVQQTQSGGSENLEGMEDVLEEASIGL